MISLKVVALELDYDYHVTYLLKPCIKTVGDFEVQAITILAVVQNYAFKSLCIQGPEKPYQWFKTIDSNFRGMEQPIICSMLDLTRLQNPFNLWAGPPAMKI